MDYGNITVYNADGADHALNIVQDGLLASAKAGLNVYATTQQTTGRGLVYLNLPNNSTIPVLYANNEGNGTCVQIEQSVVQGAGKYALYVHSNVAQVNAPLVYLHQQFSTATQDVLEINNNGDGRGMYMKTQAGAGGGIQLDNTSGQDGIYILQNVALASSKYALRVISNTAQTVGASLVIFSQAASSTIPVQIITNAGTGHGLSIQQDGVLAAAKRALEVGSASAQVNGDPLVYFHLDSASSTNPLITLVQAGTGIGLRSEASNTGPSGYFIQSGLSPAIVINNSANGAHFRLSGDPTVAAPADGDIWFDGTNLKMQIGATTYNIDMSAA